MAIRRHHGGFPIWKMIPRLRALVVASLILPACSARADVLLERRARDAINRATKFLCSITTHGGYAGIYALDLSERYSESLRNRIPPSKVWIQPPGTPAVGEVFLRAYRLTRDRTYLDAARNVGRCLAWAQRESGGWSYLADMKDFRRDFKRPPRKPGACTFDDDTTQAAVTFLMHLDQVLDEPWLSDAVELGLKHVRLSQFSNGAWPQRYPLRGGYHDYYTFNDKVINSCIGVMLEAHELYRDNQCLHSARRGGDFMIASQLSRPRAGWAQQYSHDMKPAPARNFEPLAVCSLVTARNITTLFDLYLYTGDRKYLDPIEPAIEWLEKSKLAKDRWARFYDPGTGRAVYGDTDGKLHDTLEEISEERRHGYAWQGSFGIPKVIRRWETLLRSGPERFRAEGLKRSIPSMKEVVRLESRVARIIKSQDSRGRWVRDDKIYILDFVTNLKVLCQYLEVQKENSP
ncbi:MAG: pectate lyase [Phycisphaerae bacterium]